MAERPRVRSEPDHEQREADRPPLLSREQGTMKGLKDYAAFHAAKEGPSRMSSALHAPPLLRTLIPIHQPCLPRLLRPACPAAESQRNASQMAEVLQAPDSDRARRDFVDATRNKVRRPCA